MSKIILSLMVFAFLSNGVSARAENTVKIRAAHFPTLTHAPALVARAKGYFEEKFSGKAAVDWKTFNAGPEAVEALFANAIDILYVGPNPAANGFVRSEGKALRVIAGVASGGSAFVVRSGSGIEKFEDIQGKRVSAPQAGNSQDIALRRLMKEKNLAPKNQGGPDWLYFLNYGSQDSPPILKANRGSDVEVFNIAGGDQLTAMLKGEVDAVWTVEPWVSRLESESNGKVLFDEKELWPNGRYATALLVVRKKFMDEHPDLVEEWVRAHIEIINWMNQNLTEAKQLFNEELKRETGKSIPSAYLDRSFERIIFTYDPMESSVLASAQHAGEIGFLGRKSVNLSGLYELSFLNSAQKQIPGKEHS